MGLFSGPWLTKEEHERSVHLNLISRINSLELNALEQGAKLQLAQGRVEELEEQKALLDEHLSQACSNIKKRDDRIAELEAILELSVDFASKQQSLGKEFEKVLFDNLDYLYVVDPELEKGDE